MNVLTSQKRIDEIGLTKAFITSLLLQTVTVVNMAPLHLMVPLSMMVYVITIKIFWKVFSLLFSV